MISIIKFIIVKNCSPSPLERGWSEVLFAIQVSRNCNKQQLFFYPELI